VVVYDEGGEVWNNSEGFPVVVRGSWEGDPVIHNGFRHAGHRALTQSQAIERLQGVSSTLDSLVGLQLPEIIEEVGEEMGSTGVEWGQKIEEFSVTCTVEGALGEQVLDGDFSVALLPEPAVNWKILLNATSNGKNRGRKSSASEEHSDFSVRCDDEADLRTKIRGISLLCVCDQNSTSDIFD
jgi:hypothetical protein